MKRILSFIQVVVLLLLLCSCSSENASDTYFVHAMGFDKENENYVLYCVCEKLGEEESDYFTVKQTGTDIKEAIIKTQKEYKDCYFATSELAIIPTDADEEFISHIATELCDSNVLPTKSSIYTYSGGKPENFLKLLKTQEDFKLIKKLSSGKETNIVCFFAKFLSGKDVDFFEFSINSEGQIDKATILSTNKDKTKNDQQIIN